MPHPDRSLTARGLRRRFGRRTVVDNFDIDVGGGELVGLLGSNGAGKTTTFRMLAGLVPPHGGRVSIDGLDATRWPLWRRARAGLGYLPQSPSVFRRLTVAENIDAGLRAAGLSATKRRESGEALLASFELDALADARGDTLSGGERRRVEIARALAARPSYLLVDEPFAGLDPKGTATLAGHLRQLADGGVGVILTDHNVRQTLEVCDRAYILHAGCTLMVGVPEAVARDPAVRDRFLGPRFELDPPQTVGSAPAHGRP